MDGHAAARHAAAREAGVGLGDLRVVAPEFFARGGVERVDDAPGSRHVHRAVHHDGRRLDTSHRLEVGGPRESQLGDVLGVDLCQWAVALFRVGAPVAQPIRGVLPGRAQARIAHVPGLYGGSRGRGLCASPEAREQDCEGEP